jgi:hypothetical protein
MGPARDCPYFGASQAEDNATPLHQPMEIARPEDPIGELSDQVKEKSLPPAAKDFAASGGSIPAADCGLLESVKDQPNPLNMVSPVAYPKPQKVISETSPSPYHGSTLSLN